MAPRLRWFVGVNLSLASYAYAAHMKRAGHGYYAIAIAAMYTSSEDPALIYAGRMPSRAVILRDSRISRE